MNNIVKRITNYGTLIAIVSQILIILQIADVGIDLGKFEALAIAILEVLTLLGIINNPEKGNWYGDGE